VTTRSDVNSASSCELIEIDTPVCCLNSCNPLPPLPIIAPPAAAGTVRLHSTRTSSYSPGDALAAAGFHITELPNN